jgi:large subunit ribosomal protein L4
MLKAKLFKNANMTEVTLPKEVSEKFSMNLLDQAVLVYEDNSHFGFAKVKTRSEVNRTKKKVYKQKGTGGARHGAKSAHIFIGGGVVHGPTGEKKKLLLPTKMKIKATMAAVSYMFKTGHAALIEGLSKVKKTSESEKALKPVKKALEIKSQILVVLTNGSADTLKYFNNIDRVTAVLNKDLNAYRLLRGGFVVFDSELFTVKEKSPTTPKATKGNIK